MGLVGVAGRRGEVAKAARTGAAGFHEPQPTLKAHDALKGLRSIADRGLEPTPKLALAQGYADGYMRMLVDAGICGQAELLALVGEVRRGVDGPAVGRITLDESVAA